MFDMAASMYWLTYLCLLFYAVSCESKKQKRLLLNDPDVARDIASMKSMIQTLSNQVTQLQTTSGGGSTYVHWGRSKCSGESTELVYSGYAAGQLYTHTQYTARYGGPSNFLCLPVHPEPSNVTTNGYSLLFGTEYEENILTPDATNEDVPCAVCRSTNTRTSLMIPGRKTCNAGWKIGYNGLLASGHRAYTASTYICIDSKPEYIPGGHVNNDGSLLYITTLKCGSLPCPPYHNDKAVNCVVCSK